MPFVLRPLLMLAALATLALGAAAWMVFHAHAAERGSAERSAVATTHALVRMVEGEMAGNRNALPQAGASVLAAWETGAAAGMEGMLVDGRGHVVLARPADLLGDVQHASGLASAVAANGSAALQGWTQAEDAEGHLRRAYYLQSPQQWTWVTLVHCTSLDPACSPGVYWMAGASLLLVALMGLLLWRPGLAGGSRNGLCMADADRQPQAEPVAPQPSSSLDRQEHMAMMGRLAGRFAHEFNNQLGVISNSAYLIQRRADDARLALPAQAMLRAVDAASRLTQRLQKLGAKPYSQPQVLDLSLWLPSMESSSLMVLGKRVELQLQVEPGPLLVRVDADELELALTSLLLCLRETLVDGAQANLYARVLREPGARELAPGDYVEICVEASATWSGRQAAHVPGAPLVWTPVEGCDPLDLTLAKRLCRACGGDVWAFNEPDRSLAVCLVLPRAHSVPHPGGQAS